MKPEEVKDKLKQMGEGPKNVEHLAAPNTMTKEQYMKEVMNWPLPVIHLTFCDVVVGPPIIKELIPIYNALGMDMDIPTDEEYDEDEDLENQVLKSTKVSKEVMMEYSDLIWICYGCSMTRDPKIYCPQIDFDLKEFVPKDHASRIPSRMYYDDLYPPDQMKIMNLGQDKSFEVLETDKFRKPQEPADDQDGDAVQDVRCSSSPVVGDGDGGDPGPGSEGGAEHDMLPVDPAGG